MSAGAGAVRATRILAASMLALAAGCGGRDRVVDVPTPQGATGPFDAYPAYLWCEARIADDVPASLVERVGGVAAESGLVPTGAERARIYVGHAVRRDVLHVDRSATAEEHATWLTRRGEALPRRPVGLADGDVVTAQCERVRSVVAASPGADFVSLGDEVSTTPFGDPLDLGGRGGSPTDELLGILDGPDVEAFLAARRSEQGALLDALDAFAGAARTASPEVRVALLGVGARTPWGGLAPRELVDRFEVLEPYDVGLAAIGVASIAPPSTSVLRTVFTESPAACAQQLFEHVVRGGDGAVLWSRGDLDARPDARDELLAALGAARALRSSRRGVGAGPSGVAILVDERSDARSWLLCARRQRLTWPRRLAGFETEHGSAFARREQWRVALEDAGLLPGALAVAELDDPAASSRFPVVVATGLDLGDERVLRRLEAHVARGGTVLLDDVRSLGLERVVRAPSGLAAHALTRDVASPRAARLAAELRRVVREAGVAPPPARFESTNGAALVQSWSRAPDGAWYGAAVAAARTPEERAALRLLEARLVDRAAGTYELLRRGRIAGRDARRRRRPRRRARAGRSSCATSGPTEPQMTSLPSADSTSPTASSAVVLRMSRSGLISTISRDTSLPLSATFSMNRCDSRNVAPPGTTVPVPGAYATSQPSTSKERWKPSVPSHTISSASSITRCMPIMSISRMV
ncbi:MAG: hypothetical protein R3F34_00310 [Planctomycetota bacterium]